MFTVGWAGSEYSLSHSSWFVWIVWIALFTVFTYLYAIQCTYLKCFYGSSVSFRSENPHIVLLSFSILCPLLKISEVWGSFAHVGGSAPVQQHRLSLPLKTSSVVQRFGLLEGSLTCSPGAIVTSWFLQNLRKSDDFDFSRSVKSGLKSAFDSAQCLPQALSQSPVLAQNHANLHDSHRLVPSETAQSVPPPCEQQEAQPWKLEPYRCLHSNQLVQVRGHGSHVHRAHILQDLPHECPVHREHILGVERTRHAPNM